MRLPLSTVAGASLLAMATLFTPGASAHFFPESANCKAPAKPLEFITELDKKEFDGKVDQYRACLESFVGKQNEAMGKHKQAAEKAAADWKHYAETVLKAKVNSAPPASPAAAATPDAATKP